jgi:hypothetical protein
MFRERQPLDPFPQGKEGANGQGEQQRLRKCATPSNGIATAPGTPGQSKQSVVSRVTAGPPTAASSQYVVLGFSRPDVNRSPNSRIQAVAKRTCICLEPTLSTPTMKIER